MNFGQKLLACIDNPRSAGSYTHEEARGKGMRLAVATEGSRKEGRIVRLFLLVDESDGVIADAKYLLFGPPALIGAAESACVLLLRKNYDQARRLTADLLDKEIREKGEKEAFPPEMAWVLNLLIDAIDTATSQCMDIPISDIYVAPPITSSGQESKEYPGWQTLSVKEKISVIEGVIAEDIRPYVELDAGGVQVLNLIEGREVIISYEGACTTCHSATGATLNAIQQILRTKVHPELVVIPNL
ncbi:MAG: NifU family protein [Chlamydiales bacterium]